VVEHARSGDEAPGGEGGVEDEGGEVGLAGDLDAEGLGGPAPGEPGIERDVASAVEGIVEEW
jgi:hypothetical protein